MLELGEHPAGERVKHRPVELAAHAELVAALSRAPPHER